MYAKLQPPVPKAFYKETFFHILPRWTCQRTTSGYQHVLSCREEARGLRTVRLGVDSISYFLQTVQIERRWDRFCRDAHHHHWAAVVSRGWAKASACRLQITLSCAVLCHIVSIAGSRGGLGGTCPPRPFEIEYFFVVIFLLVYVSCQIGLLIHEYRAGDERMCGKYPSPASESGRFLEMGYEKSLLLPPPPPLNRAGLWRSRKISATTAPPPPLNRAGLWRSRKISATTPPPPTESGRLMEITEIIC